MTVKGQMEKRNEGGSVDRLKDQPQTTRWAPARIAASPVKDLPWQTDALSWLSVPTFF